MIKFKFTLVAIVLVVLITYFGYLPTVFGICLILLGIGYIVYGVVHIQTKMFLPAYCKSASKIKQVSITFDDGPHTEGTERILEILDKYNVKATFFIIGKNAQKYPEILQDIVKRGHAIGNHSYNHGWNFPMKSSKAVLAEIRKTQDVIEQITGLAPAVFRPPFGVSNPHIFKAVKKLELTTLGWSIRSLDTKKEDSGTVLKRVIFNTKNGAVVLFHDKITQTAQTLELYLQYLAQNGYAVVLPPALFPIKMYKNQ